MLPPARLAATAGLLATPLLPAWLAVHVAHPRLRGDLAARWGGAVAPVEPGAVWIVAASVGEIAAASALLPHLRGPVLLTADTDTGVQAARRVVVPHRRAVAAARPVDHPWTLAPLWAEARPRALIFVEGALWPSLVRLARRSGVPVLGVQARPGRAERGWVGSRWRADFDAVVARDAEAAEALRALGLPIVGHADLKADHRPSIPPLSGLEGAVVASSTREARVERAFVRECMVAAPGRPVVIAPRHPERFDAVVAALAAEGWRVARRTTLSGAVPPGTDVLVLDTLGELDGVLAVADVVLIGGTFDPSIGGHSPTAAATAGARVLAGPHRHADPGAFVRAQAVDVTLESLAVAIAQALLAGRRAGGTSRAGAATVEALSPWLSGPPAPESPPRPWAAPLVGPWRAATALHRGLRRARVPVRLPVPVIAVGSANARGAGKTAAAAWVARELGAGGRRVGIVCRGHARERLGGPRQGTYLSTMHPDARFLGDDGMRLALAGHLVAAGPDRVEAARAAIDAGAEILVLEDALWLPGVVRDLDLAVVDARRPRARGPIPMGERRFEVLPADVDALLWVEDVEPASQGEPGASPGVPHVRLVAEPGPWFLGHEPYEPPESATAVLGVGSPGAALCSLRRDVRVDQVKRLADHAPIGHEVAKLLERGHAVVTTAKDAARLPAALRARVHWRDVVLTGAWPSGIAVGIPRG